MSKQWFAGSTIEDIIAASALDCIFPLSWRKIYANTDTLQEVYASDRNALVKLGCTDTMITAIKGRLTQVKAQLHLMESLDIKLITLDNPDYPKLLKQIADPPLWLYYRGDLKCLSRPTMTVVGTRKPSTYALTAMDTLFADTLLSNVTTVSGLAYGIDKKIHQKSTELEQPTVAVLAGGLDSIYPVEHTNLAKKIVELGGALISEYAPLSRPQPYRFPIRNRIIAGLSPATIIIEAALKSGTMTTAKSALDYNRDLFAVPADINRRNAEGNNFLLEKGAAVLREARTLLDYYGLEEKNSVRKIDSSLQKILDLVTDEPKTVDQLLQITRRPIEQLLADLTRLELGGMIYQKEFGSYYRKK